jgi:MFS transporter, ACS family, hexuronate transporter
MKIKGLRWYIIGLIMMITIINYLDRGTLNYMWVANIDYELVEKQPIDMSSNVAVKTDKGYRLFSTRGDDMIVDEGSVTIIAHNLTLDTRIGIGIASHHHLPISSMVSFLKTSRCWHN